MNPDPELTGLAIVVLVLVVILSTWWGRGRKRPHGPDVGLAVLLEEPTCCEDGCDDCGAPMAIEEPPPFVRTNLGFGRRNPHCSNCGDLRGGYFGHEASECKYRYGMTASEVAAILPEHQRNAFWDEQIDRYFAEQERAS